MKMQFAKLGEVMCFGLMMTFAGGVVAADDFLIKQRDSTIRNWMTRVDDSPRCLEFKQRFVRAGTRHEGSLNANFVGDMMKVMEAARAANCEFKP